MLRTVLSSKKFSICTRISPSKRALAVLPITNGHGHYTHPAFRPTMLGLFAAMTTALFFSNQADNCGIVGVVGGSDDASKYLLEGLTILRNRGYVPSTMEIMCNNQPT